MDERRKLDRRLLTFFSRVIDRNTGRLIGYLVDISIEGALLVGNVSLRPNSRLQLRIDLPERFAPRTYLELEARTIWTKPDSDPELYRAGLELVDLAPADQALLQTLIKDYGLIR